MKHEYRGYKANNPVMVVSLSDIVVALVMLCVVLAGVIFSYKIGQESIRRELEVHCVVKNPKKLPEHFQLKGRPGSFTCIPTPLEAGDKL